MFKKRINFLITAMLLGLVTFILCLAHPAIGDEPHGPAAGVEESCQTTTLPSAITKTPMATKSDGASNPVDHLVHPFTALDFEGVGSGRMSGNTVPPVSSHCSVKLYKLICTYRL